VESFVEKLKNNGWSTYTDPNFQSIIKQTNIEIKVFSHELDHLLSNYSELGFSKPVLFKALVRSFSRHSNGARRILEYLHENAEKMCLFDNEKYYLTLCLPMMHLPKPNFSGGPFHVDHYGYMSRSQSIWIPIIELFGKPISLIPKSHKGFLNFFLRVTKKILKKFDPFPILFQKKPKIKLGNLYSWDGNTIHKGNINTSSDFTLSLVIKLTPYPVMSEPTIEVTNNLLDMGEEENPSPEKMLETLLETLGSKAMQQNFLTCGFEQFFAMFDNHIKQNSYPISLCKRVSYALYWLAGDEKDLFTCTKYHLASLAFYSDNVISIRRVLENLNEENNDSFRQFIGKRYNYSQVHHCIDEINTSGNFLYWNS